jgi:hypothetical protein
VSGGIQAQSWNGESHLQSRSVEYNQLNTCTETITWTQRMLTNGTELFFEIANGESATWGEDFGKSLMITENAGLSDLNDYNSASSVDNASITFGSNRVDLLQITEVRKYDQDGDLISVDSTPKTIFNLDDQ